jgi:hypothetical protein
MERASGGIWGNLNRNFPFFKEIWRIFPPIDVHQGTDLPNRPILMSTTGLTARLEEKPLFPPECFLTLLPGDFSLKHPKFPRPLKRGFRAATGRFPQAVSAVEASFDIHPIFMLHNEKEGSG